MLLDQQRNDEDLVGTAARPPSALSSAAPIAGCMQRLEVRARLGIGEHDVAQRRPIEMPVGGENRRAEALDQALERRLPGLDHLAGDLVRCR